MSGFRNILVGIDLTRSRPTGGSGLDPVIEIVARRAEWIARESRALLTFLSVLPLPVKEGRQVWRLPPSGAAEQPASGLEEEAVRCTLANLVHQARKRGTEAGAVLACGQGWVEIIRQVQHDRHDLLVVGTHDPHGLRRILLGSTAQKLLHECPCPVWVSKPSGDTAPRNILVASDLSSRSDEAVRLGLALSRLASVSAHLFHAVDYPLDRPWSADSEDVLNSNYRRRIRAEAELALRAQAEQDACPEGQPPPTIHLADRHSLPAHAILKFIRDHHIDLLVLGTAARHGLAGVLFGNTAERLLPEVPCSLLVARPAAHAGP
jgi:universal stress protein E